MTSLGAFAGFCFIMTARITMHELNGFFNGTSSAHNTCIDRKTSVGLRPVVNSIQLTFMTVVKSFLAAVVYAFAITSMTDAMRDYDTSSTL